MKKAETLQELEEWVKSLEHGTIYLAQSEKPTGGVLFSDEDSTQPPVELKTTMFVESDKESILFKHTFVSNTEYEEAQEMIDGLRKTFTLKNVDEEEIQKLL